MVLKNVPVSVEDWMRIGLALKLYEHAPESARKFFGRDYNSDKEIEQDFLRQTDSRDMATPEAQRMGTGYTYRVFQYYCETGNLDQAQLFLDTLTGIQHEMPIAHLGGLAQLIGRDYQKLSMNAGKLLRPSELDDIAFRDHAPESAEHSQDYAP